MTTRRRMAGLLLGRGAPTLAVLVAFCGACWSVSRVAGRGSPPLSVADKDLNLGDVWEQDNFPLQLTIRNDTKGPIEIERFSTSCGCASIEPRSPTVPPRMGLPVRVTLNLTMASGPDTRDFAVRVVPWIADPSRRVPSAILQQDPFTIRGRTHRVLRLSVRRIDFGRQKLFQGQAFPAQSVIVIPAVQVDSLKAACPTTFASVDVVPSDGHGKEIEVRVTPQRALPAGPFRFDVTLQAYGTGERYPVARIPVEGVILSDIQAFPDSLVLGDRKIGETVTETITLRSASDTGFDVIGIKSDSADTLVEPTTVPGIEDAVFNIAQKITKLGRQATFTRFLLRSKSGVSSTLVMKAS